MELNPFAVPVEERNTRSRKKARRSALTYTPVRKPVIPSDDAVRLLIELATSGWTANDGKVIAPDPGFAALIGLCAYTGPRPESEPCKVRRCDIELPEPGRVRSMSGSPVLGSVTYSDTKDGDPRTVPLHPHAAALLVAVLCQCPDAPDAALFRKRGSVDPWDRNSYRDRWARLRSRVAEDHPEVERMWLRDFRKLFKTRLLEAGANPVAVKVLQGHSLSVDERYYELTAEHAASVVLMLDWQPGREVGREASQAEDRRLVVSR